MCSIAMTGAEHKADFELKKICFEDLGGSWQRYNEATSLTLKQQGVIFQNAILFTDIVPYNCDVPMWNPVWN